jgi:hypothetical protein
MKSLNIYFFLPLLICLTSCFEKEVDLIFDQVEQKIIVTAWLDNSEDIQYVTVARSVDYTGPQPQEMVSGAIVALLDDQGVYELEELEMGKYQLPQDITLQIGKSYTLEVNVNGNLYQAKATMFPCPEIADVNYALVKDSTDKYEVGFSFEDSVDEENYYYLRDYKKGSQEKDTLSNGGILSDEFINGELLIDISIPRFDNFYNKGDTAIVELYSLSSEAFFYLESVLRGENIDPIIALPPANVLTNISNGALGYFLMSARQFKEIRIE